MLIVYSVTNIALYYIYLYWISLLYNIDYFE